MLHRLRPFVLQNEALFVPKYLSAFRRENQYPVALAAADCIRDAFFVRDSGIVLQTQEGLMDFGQQWQNYANAYEYHRDPKKREQLARTFAAGPAIADFVFWFAGLLKIKTTLSMQGLAALLAAKAESFVVNLRDEPETQARGA